MKKTIRDMPEDLSAALEDEARRMPGSLRQEVLGDLSGERVMETGAESGARVEREIQVTAELRSRATGFLTAAEIAMAKREGLN